MITSASNPKIKQIAALLAKSKTRKEEGLFVAEGFRLVMETPEDRLVTCFISDEADPEDEEKIREQFPAEKIETVKNDILEKVSATKSPQGFMAVVKIVEGDPDEYAYYDNGLLLLLENLQDPGNLGSMIRTAEGAGVNAIICTKGTVDIYNPKVVRSTMGAMYRVPVFYVEDLKAYIKHLRNNGYNVYAAAMDGAVDHYEAKMKGKCAFIIGNEANGISDGVIAAAGQSIKISMAGKLESLNASVAGAVLMYEAKRQRLTPDPGYDFMSLFSDEDRYTKVANSMLDNEMRKRHGGTAPEKPSMINGEVGELSQETVDKLVDAVKTDKKVDEMVESIKADTGASESGETGPRIVRRKGVGELSKGTIDALLKDAGKE